ncbi:anaerobic ribonucleoside-triphosphate reductase activating protein [Caminibacter pacificus]|uniref:Anaerobic ribonucleoside-triphosphate reductase activating protein n=1 Tax=Caminibacter pacificus TaxID=1424653 RepID=A0AAJ4RAS9_9BACT|nr:anaerobic ribonucleoside-triphosphate reductase activating protein [Caminibacter pacificus]QCI29172.1 anaerobic ribonucleoside-triphosphate reductase activating protein [Caminibacter pacificus]ROR38816.1 pyruvate formate lyase activating enzyme [Caminibacter pacificus]
MLGIFSFQKFSTLDFPGCLAAIIWFSGCNMRCPYCYNKDVVFGEKRIEEDEILDFLKKRVGLLDGVSFTGGEATLYKNLIPFSQKIKDLGFDIKLDTNGLNFDVIRNMVEKNLVDYIALDFKAPPEKFELITKNRHYEKFEKTLDFLIGSDVDFEVRTTVHTDFLDENDINEIIKILHQKGYKGTYYLQNYFETEKETIGNIGPQKRKLDTSKLLDLIPIEFRNF